MGLPHRIIIAATASYLIHETHQTLATCNAECKLSRKEGWCPVRDGPLQIFDGFDGNDVVFDLEYMTMMFTPCNNSNHSRMSYQWFATEGEGYSVKGDIICDRGPKPPRDQACIDAATLPDDPSAADAFEVPVNPDETGTIYIEPEGPAYIDSNVPAGTAGRGECAGRPFSKCAKTSKYFDFYGHKINRLRLYGYGAIGFKSVSYPSVSVYRADEETYSGRLPTAWDDVNQFMYDERFIGDQRRVGGEWKGGSGFWIRDAACVLCVDNMPANQTVFKMQFICVDIGYPVCSDGVRCDDTGTSSCSDGVQCAKDNDCDHTEEKKCFHEDCGHTFDGKCEHKRICAPDERIVISFKQKDGSKEHQIALYIQTGQIRMSWLDIGDWATKNKTIVGLSHGLTPWWEANAYDGLDLSSSIGCIDNANCTVIDEIRRPYGPTRPTTTLPHPHVGAPVGNPAYAGFCEFGCAAFYFNRTVAGCRKVCQDTYTYDVTPGYSDRAEVARFECYDGCSIGNLRCQPGSYCQHEIMHRCPPGKYRDVDYHHVTRCDNCPHGRFREDEGGRFMESCVKCEPGRFNVNVGSASKFDCLRCPPGRFANEPGMKQCKCMNQYDGYFEVNLNNTRVYGPCQPETHLDTVIRPRIVTIDWAPRTTYP